MTAPHEKAVPMDLDAMFKRLQSVEWHLHLAPERLGRERCQLLGDIAAEALRLRAEATGSFSGEAI